MRVVYYEYCLKGFTKDGDLDIELTAKRLRHFSESVEISADGIVSKAKQPGKGKKAHIASRYSYNNSAAQSLTNESIMGFIPRQSEHKPKGGNKWKEAWKTSLRK